MLFLFFFYEGGGGGGAIGGGVKGVGHVTYFFMRGFLIENKLTVTHKSNMLFLFFFL